MGVADRFRKMAEKFNKKRMKDTWGNLKKKWSAKGAGDAEKEMRYDTFGNPIGTGGALPKGFKKKPELSAKYKGSEFEKDSEGGIRIRGRRISAGFIVGIVVVGIAAVAGITFFFANSLFQSIFGIALMPLQSLLNQQISGVPLRDTGTYLSCVGGYLLNPGGLVQGSSGESVFSFIDTTCKQDLVGAQEIGCSECFEISVEPLNPRVFAGTGQKAIFSARVSAQDKEFCYNDLFGERTCQPLTPAAEGKISIDAGENVKADLQSNLNLCQAGISSISCSEIDPAIISVTPLTVVGSVGADQLCGSKTNAIEARATLEYIYRTEGSAPIYIQKAKIGETKQVNFNVRDPITLPGPVKVDIIPDAYLTGNTYNPLLTNNFFIFVKFRNVGEGGAEVQKLELKQIAPEKTSPLAFKGCSGPIDDKGQESNGVITVVPEKDTFTLSPTERSGTILCEFAIPADLKSELSTYIITGAATYNYTLQRESSSVIIDQTRCGKEASGATTGTTGTAGGTGGIQQVETLK